MKRIYINATQKEELRVAIVDGQKLIDLDLETSSAGRKKGNIYKGVISRVEPGLDAVFVDYGDPKHGFLPFREISQAYFKNKTAGGRNNSQAIAKALRQGQALLVQIQREGHGGKGAALTTFLSLAGRYLVLMPNSPRAGGVSRRMDDKVRDTTRQALSQLNIREEEGVIIRTKGAGRDVDLLRYDLDYLRTLWDSIVAAAKGRTAPFLVYEESNIVICALRDHFDDNTEEIIVDDADVFADACNFVNLVMPQHIDKIKLYQEAVPLFSRYHIEVQIETAFDREITLPSGGSVVFDRSEALLSIDINSGKATRGSNIEETALSTNLEAAEEIARQLRLRDLGGLLVIDFIDMFSQENRKKVENRLHEETRQDPARIQLERISRFGLLEMSRQRIRPSLSESSYMVCPRCSGRGSIRTLESSALATLRMMEDEAVKEKSGRIVAQLPLEVTSFLLNEKREKINEIETRHGVQLMIVADPQMEIPHFQIRRYRNDDATSRDKYSYELATERKTHLPEPRSKADNSHARPAVGPAVNFMKLEKPAEKSKDSKISIFFSSLFRKKQPQETEDGTREASSSSRRRRRGGRRRNRSQERQPSSAQRQGDHSSFQENGQNRHQRSQEQRQGDQRGFRGNGQNRHQRSQEQRQGDQRSFRENEQNRHQRSQEQRQGDQHSSFRKNEQNRHQRNQEQRQGDQHSSFRENEQNRHQRSQEQRQGERRQYGEGEPSGQSLKRGQQGDSRHNPNRSRKPRYSPPQDRQSSPSSAAPAFAPVPPDKLDEQPSQAKHAADVFSVDQPAPSTRSTVFTPPMPTPDSPAETRAIPGAADSFAEKNQERPEANPMPCPTPRFPLPKNLTQVETKPKLPDQN